MSEIIGEATAHCPQCGAALMIERLGDNPEPTDRIFCPDHGTIGTREEIRKQIVAQAGGAMVRKISEDFASSLRDMGFTVTRE